MAFVIGVLTVLRRWGQALGPYLMLEILLPGGTVLALLFFLYRRRAVAMARPPAAKPLEPLEAGVER